MEELSESMRIWLCTIQAKVYVPLLQYVINEPPGCLFKEAQNEVPAPVTPIGGRH